MRKPYLEEVVLKLQLVLDGKISREDVSYWAQKISQIYESESSLSEKDITIWRFMDTLIGIDLKDSPTEYLHNEADIRNWISSIVKMITLEQKY